MENSKVQVTDLHKYYGKLEVLKGIDMTVKQGEVVSLIGPSGSGKSTFLQLYQFIGNSNQRQYCGRRKRNYRQKSRYQQVKTAYWHGISAL